MRKKSEKTTNTCRICLNEIAETEQYYLLIDLKLQFKLLNVLQEINLNITPNPVACNQCMITIEEIYEFKQLCIETETTVKKLRQIPRIDVLTNIKKETIKNELVDYVKVELSNLEIISNACLETNACFEEPSKPKLYYCYNCDFNTSKKAILILHIHRHLHEKLCYDNCNCKTFLTKHKRKHTGKKSFKCNICDYCTIYISNLKRHMCKHSSEKPFKCNICDYRGTNKLHLKMHMHKHTGEKPFKCNICDYCSTIKSHLKIHMSWHTGEKPFKCNICDYCSTSKSHLKTHIRRHIGEKPFKCNICDYCSATKTDLNNHLRTHTGEKPFKCNICNYCANQMTHLKKHMRTHTDEKPFKCNICNYGGNQKTHLKIHMRKHTVAANREI